MGVPVLYEVEQIAEIMHCSEDYARAQLRARVWPGVKIASRWHMTEDQLMEAIAGSSTEAQEIEKSKFVPRSRFRRRTA